MCAWCTGFPPVLQAWRNISKCLIQRECVWWWPRQCSVWTVYLSLNTCNNSSRAMRRPEPSRCDLLISQLLIEGNAVSSMLTTKMHWWWLTLKVDQLFSCTWRAVQCFIFNISSVYLIAWVKAPCVILLFQSAYSNSRLWFPWVKKSHLYLHR